MSIQITQWYSRWCDRTVVRMSAALLLVTLLGCSASPDHHRVKIRCSLLESLDKFKIVNTNNIAEFIRQIGHMRSIKFTTPDGRGFTLSELAQLEREGHLPPAVCQKLIRALVGRTLAISQPHMYDLHNHRPAFEKIIIAWQEQSGRQDCLLIAWSEAEPDLEEEFLRDRMVSLQLMDQFLNELQDFLTDLVYSCPHSREFHARHAAREKNLDTHIG